MNESSSVENCNSMNRMQEKLLSLRPNDISAIDCLSSPFQSVKEATGSRLLIFH